jgi:hypothetical protein
VRRKFPSTHLILDFCCADIAPCCRVQRWQRSSATRRVCWVAAEAACSPSAPSSSHTCFTRLLHCRGSRRCVICHVDCGDGGCRRGNALLLGPLARKSSRRAAALLQALCVMCKGRLPLAYATILWRHCLPGAPGAMCSKRTHPPTRTYLLACMGPCYSIGSHLPDIHSRAPQLPNVPDLKCALEEYPIYSAGMCCVAL